MIAIGSDHGGYALKQEILKHHSCFSPDLSTLLSNEFVLYDVHHLKMMYLKKYLQSYMLNQRLPVIIQFMQKQ